MIKNLFNKLLDIQWLGSVVSITGFIMPYFNINVQLANSFIFGVVTVIFIALYNKQRNILIENKELKDKNISLNQQCEKLRMKPCLFINNCDYYHILDEYIDKVNGYFPYLEELKMATEQCEKCARDTFRVKHPGTYEKFVTLCDQINSFSSTLEQQKFSVFIDSLKEHSEIKERIQQYLEYHQIHCIQMSQNEKINNSINSINVKTIVIYLYCEPSSTTIEPSTELKIKKSLEAYSHTIINVNREKQMGLLEVWLCTPHKYLLDNINMPQGIIIKKMKQCDPEFCVKPEDFTIYE